MQPVSTCLVVMQNNLVIRSFDCNENHQRMDLDTANGEWIVFFFYCSLFVCHANAAVADHKFFKLNANKEKKNANEKNHFVDVDSVQRISTYQQEK